PGRGDKIVVLFNVRLAWLAEDGNVTLAMLGSDSSQPTSLQVETLRTHPENINAELASLGYPLLDVETIQQLLALDPFVAGGPHAVPPSPRFVAKGGFLVDFGQDGFS